MSALVFTGFMGSGKSAAARTVAKSLGDHAIDTDTLLEQQLGMTVEQFFDRFSEDEFRQKEEQLVLKLLAEADGDVIAVGGGTLLSERVRAALAQHTTVLLEVDIETAWRRAAGKGRPLARDREAFERLYRDRQALYESCADAVVMPGHRDRVLTARDHLLALPKAPAETKLIWATSASGDYPVLIGNGLLGSDYWPLSGKQFCVSDTAVASLYLSKLQKTTGIADSIEIEPGEHNKTLQTAEAVWRKLAQLGMTRYDRLIALGGGVVGDLAGFCAAAYQRGVPVVQVPTTVVAQVDSAYGGKTGVDLPEAKNYVGAYHQPVMVMVDPQTLETLPEREWAAGYAEVVKTALLAGGELWRAVASGSKVDGEVVLGCARTKLATVAQDERDSGARQSLNLGHTVGHAIETVTDYGMYRHGEAVGLGLLVALTLSGLPKLRNEVEELLKEQGLPTRLSEGVEIDEIVAATGRDKKRQGDSVPFVLLKEPGKFKLGCKVTDRELTAALKEITA